MSPSELTAYLHSAIPLSRAMQAAATAVGDRQVTMAAPLEPNSNHRGTAFGGSLSSLAVLAGFSVVLLGTRSAGFDHRVVIQRNAYDYLLPADGPFEASAAAEAGRWERFLETLERRDRARVAVDAVVTCDGATVGRLRGLYAAIG